MAVTDLSSWIDEFAREGTVWCAKRLSGNDTLANGSHQAGPYIPKDFLFELFPSISNQAIKNPDQIFPLYVDSHSDHREVRVIWYNNRFHKDPVTNKTGTRNETRITNFGGQESALLNADSSGSIAVFLFVLGEGGQAAECHVWVCDNKIEEDQIEERIGVVEPKLFVMWRPGTEISYVTASIRLSVCTLSPDKIPPAWLTKFPTGEEIVAKTRELRSDDTLSVDERLLRRRDCEFEIFKSVEEAVYISRIKGGFTTVDGFISLAQTILQSRKSRSGTSLELHARDIFTEETLVQDKHFSHRPVIEGGKRPDFIFPSTAAYNDAAFPKEKLRILAAKTTCKDRWRQVINEGDRVEVKHLLTLQQGVSVNQFAEMNAAGIRLVVPERLHGMYPDTVKPHLITLESFIADVRLMALP